MEAGAQAASSSAPDMADSGERAPTETGAGAASPLLLASLVRDTAGTGAQIDKGLVYGSTFCYGQIGVDIDDVGASLRARL
ncbi:hypothetical protein D5086_017798 [Populus alba]|uniref:Uncharacterized protein n=1 Tax=Populus alba TaxID=43335 RepID=A0ACC4BPZ7_POPAL